MNYEKKYKEALERAKQFSEKPYLEDSKGIVEYIFPELQESEDERIRKDIISLVIKWWKDDGEVESKFSSKNSMLAWLEKQSEKHLENYYEAEKEKADFVGDGFIECHADFLDFKEGDTYWLEYIGDDKYNVRSDNLLGKTYHITPCQLYTIFKKQTWLEKQAEPKYVLADAVLDNNKDGLIADTIRCKRENQCEQKPWSEEDELCLTETLYLIRNSYSVDDKVERLSNWVKSIKDRLLPQLKQEWSEDDEDNLTDIFVAIDNFHTTNHKKELITFLKSLRPQPTWKPSDEQITVINDTIRFIEDKSDSLSSDYLYNKMKELLEQLKAL